MKQNFKKSIQVLKSMKKKQAQKQERTKNPYVQITSRHLKAIRSTPGTQRTLGQVFFMRKYCSREEVGRGPISSATPKA